VLIDGLDREVSLPAPAQRIVSLAASNTEILFAVGAGPQVVGRDDFSDYPPESAGLASIGGPWGDLNAEAIVALEPDLVLAAGINSPEQVRAIENLGIPVFQLPNPEDFDGLYTNLETVGKLTGREKEAAALVAELRARVVAVTDSLAGAEPVKVYYEVDGSDPNAPWTTGSGTFQHVLITMAGGENIAADIEGWGQISLEELVARNPAVMIYGAGPWVPTTPESVADRSGWEDISAVAKGTVYGIDTNWVDRPGPRLVDALETMARLIHPDRFE
jgi:iron complex transport system substrate-binding protein